MNSESKLLFVCAADNDITTLESLQFDFETIEVATNKFSSDNKLGRGGFGEVYKVYYHFHDMFRELSKIDAAFRKITQKKSSDDLLIYIYRVYFLMDKK